MHHHLKNMASTKMLIFLAWISFGIGALLYSGKCGMIRKQHVIYSTYFANLAMRVGFETNVY